MTLDEMIEHCLGQQELQISSDPPVMFTMPGSWGKTSKKRLFKKVPYGMKNPTGKIIAEFPGSVMVQFNAQAVLDACHALKARDLEAK